MKSMNVPQVFRYLIVLLMALALFSGTQAFATEKLPKVKLTVKPLDLSRPVAREEIMSAGQLGGVLYPTHELADKEREQRINDAFAKAIQEWNKHEYKKAAVLFKQHIEEYPDSPWAAEAVLHIGCDAQYTGRYAEAQESFNWILEKFQNKEHEGAKVLANKATLRLAVLKVFENNFDEATRLFADLLQKSDNWRDKTYASHWIQRIANYSGDKLAMLNCGTMAIARLLEKEGRSAEAREVAALKAPSLSGQSLRDLQETAARYGYDMVPLRLVGSSLDKLSLPVIVQTGARNPGDSGHYRVLEKVTENGVELFDPQAGRRFEQTYEAFGREWDGVVLAVQSKWSTAEIGQRLTQAEAETIYGGCCGVPRAPSDLGAPGEGEGIAGTGSGECSYGAPTWSVNMVNMNLFVTDTPLWYDSPIGPPVEIRLSYNSQSSITYNQPFGNKWQFNYASYLVVDTGGQVTIFMPDGRHDIYSPNGSGGYITPAGVLNTLTKLAENHFTLRFPDDTIYEYAIPAGTTSLQPFLVKITDRYVQSLTFGYNANVELTTITDALGRVTTISYSSGLVTSVTDPFGRSATFEYDGNGNLTRITDMGGYWTSLSYNGSVYLTSLANSRGTTQFYIEPADGIANGSNSYPPLGSAMWQNYRITVTNPLGKKEEFYYNGYSHYAWHVSPKHYQPGNPSVPKTNYYYTTVNGKGKISSISNPDGGTEAFTYDATTEKRTSIRDSHNHTVSFAYNGKGRITSFTDAKGKTTSLSYAANNVDMKTISNSLGIVSVGYDLFHNYTSVTNRLGKTTRYAYNGYGQRTSETDALGNATGYNYYDPSHPSKYQMKEVIRDGKTLYSFTYDSLGRIQTKTDPTGLTLMYAYDNLNRMTTITWPDGKEERYIYSGCCPWLLDSYTDRGGRTTYYAYDELKRLTEVKQPDATSIKLEYDANGNLTKLIDPKNGLTRFAYDSMDRLTGKMYPDGRYEKFTYDTTGLLTSKANIRDAAAGRTTATYSYDANHNLTGITFTDGTPNVSYTYDDYNRIVGRGDGIGAWGYDYDAESRLRTVDGPWANDTLTYTYDDIGRRTSVTPQGGETISYNYDAIGRLSEIKPGARTFGFTYPASSPSPLPTTLMRPNGSFTTYQFDTINRLTNTANKNSTQAVINSYAYTYNAQDVRGSETITNGTPITATATTVTTYNYNNLNQLLSSVNPNQSLIYDADGNMTRGYTPEGYQFTATYDGENRLKTIDYTDGASVAHHTDYHYSVDGFLARQIVDGTETRYIRDGLLALQERDATNAVTRSFAWDPRAPGGIGGLLELGQGGQNYSYLFDGKGNVTSLVDGTQSVTASYTYDPFGIIMAKSGTLNQPYQFSTKPYDEKTGLSYYGYRFYAPLIGRWTNRDPLREAGGLNLYGFSLLNPVNFVDPHGLTTRGAVLGAASFTVNTAALFPVATPIAKPVGLFLGALSVGNAFWERYVTNDISDVEFVLTLAMEGANFVSAGAAAKCGEAGELVEIAVSAKTRAVGGALTIKDIIEASKKPASSSKLTEFDKYYFNIK